MKASPGLEPVPPWSRRAMQLLSCLLLLAAVAGIGFVVRRYVAPASGTSSQSIKP